MTVGKDGCVRMEGIERGISFFFLGKLLFSLGTVWALGYCKKREREGERGLVCWYGSEVCYVGMRCWMDK